MNGKEIILVSKVCQYILIKSEIYRLESVDFKSSLPGKQMYIFQHFSTSSFSVIAPFVPWSYNWEISNVFFIFYILGKTTCTQKVTIKKGRSNEGGYSFASTSVYILCNCLCIILICLCQSISIVHTRWSFRIRYFFLLLIFFNIQIGNAQ